MDDYHGVKVADPYRWLEELDSPQTRAWVAAENSLTFGFLDQLPQRAWFHDRLTRLWNYPRYGLPFKEGGQYFFTKNDGLQNQSVLYVQASLEAPARPLLDPNTLAKDGTIALASSAVSHDGKWLAYGTAAAGSDWNEVRVRSIATGRDTDDLVRWIKFSEPSWTRDGRGFFYSRFPAPKTDAGAGQTFGELADQKVYYHRLGTPQTDDTLVLEIPDQPKWVMDAAVTEDGRFSPWCPSNGEIPEQQLAPPHSVGRSERPRDRGADRKADRPVGRRIRGHRQRRSDPLRSNQSGRPPQTHRGDRCPKLPRPPNGRRSFPRGPIRSSRPR